MKSAQKMPATTGNGIFNKIVVANAIKRFERNLQGAVLDEVFVPTHNATSELLLSVEEMVLVRSSQARVLFSVPIIYESLVILGRHFSNVR